MDALPLIQLILGVNDLKATTLFNYEDLSNI